LPTATLSPFCGIEFRAVCEPLSYQGLLAVPLGVDQLPLRFAVHEVATS
jgi:hypothetical protein